jgi:hypothetical protein
VGASRTLEPLHILYNNQIYLYFAAAGAHIGVGTVLHVVGLITSSDGSVWSAPQSVLEPDQAIYPRNAPDYFKGYSTPHAVVLDNEVHTTFAAGPPLAVTELVAKHGVAGN